MFIALAILPFSKVESNIANVINMTVVGFFPITLVDDHEYSYDNYLNNVNNNRDKKESIVEWGENVCFIIPHNYTLNEAEEGGQGLKVN